MQTQIAERFRQAPDIDEAESILRRCVHCGFCLATCPTYNLLGDELDSPRGRIYQIKEVLEGQQPTSSTLTHLDRCLTCRNCETTCPSGVEYGRLVDIGRRVVEDQVPRSVSAHLLRWVLLQSLPYANRIGPVVRLGQWVRPLLPRSLRRSIPARRPSSAVAAGHGLGAVANRRRVLLLDGCVQPSMMPQTNRATTRVLERLSITAHSVPLAGCCGAINHHLNDQSTALDFIRRNIDAWWPELEQGAEAIVMTASGCGAMVREYGHLLKNDPDYAERAREVSARCVDVAQVLAAEPLEKLPINRARLGTVAYHPPCTLQHGQKLVGVTESVLTRVGFELRNVPDAHTCCGSAGTYSITQRSLSHKLRKQKIAHLESVHPERVLTSNIGCQLHIQSGTSLPVLHWIEALDNALDG